MKIWKLTVWHDMISYHSISHYIYIYIYILWDAIAYYFCSSSDQYHIVLHYSNSNSNSHSNSNSTSNTLCRRVGIPRRRCRPKAPGHLILLTTTTTTTTNNNTKTNANNNHNNNNNNSSTAPRRLVAVRALARAVVLAAPPRCL